MSTRSVLHVVPPRAFRWIEVGSIVACVVFEALLARDAWVGFTAEAPSALAVLASALVGYVAADLVSGVVHFVGDSFGTVDTPVLGRTFVLPFRSHHEHPAGICEHDFVETNGNNAFVALFLIVPVQMLVPVREGGGAVTFAVFVLVFTLFVFLTNQIHKWAHVDAPPRPVVWLQRAGVFLSPGRHLPHHSPPHGRGYCVTSGAFNALLDGVGLFPRLERLIRAVLRLPPVAR